MVVSMAHYRLYLDESETRNASGSSFFVVGGVILNASSEVAVAQELNALKLSLWAGDQQATTHILHEKEITEANKSGRSNDPCYTIFRANGTVEKLYAGLSKLIKMHSITTMGVCVNSDELSRLYPGETNPELTIALQMLLENYCHFLKHNTATGDICYESLQEPGNQPLRQRFYELEALGTMYYTPHFFQTHIGDIEFCGKNENLAGLQLADFIPNTMARSAARMPPKHDSFKQTVLRQAYNGGVGLRDKYGFKVIPQRYSVP